MGAKPGVQMSNDARIKHGLMRANKHPDFEIETGKTNEQT